MYVSLPSLHIVISLATYFYLFYSRTTASQKGSLILKAKEGNDPVGLKTAWLSGSQSLAIPIGVSRPEPLAPPSALLSLTLSVYMPDLAPGSYSSLVG